MGYRGGELIDLAAPLERGVDRFARRATGKVGRDLRARVRRHTPVQKRTPAITASYATAAAFVKARKGRLPGTLQASWRVGDVEISERGMGRRYRIPVFTMDPIAPHVEWPTMPHIIMPRRARVLTIPTIAGMRFAMIVHHPGTQGSYMMATALQEVAVTWQATVRGEWIEEARVMWRGGVS